MVATDMMYREKGFANEAQNVMIMNSIVKFVNAIEYCLL